MRAGLRTTGYCSGSQSNQPQALQQRRTWAAALLPPLMLLSATALPWGRRCKRLLAERDEARAEGYAEATLAVELSLEVDKLSESGS